GSERADLLSACERRDESRPLLVRAEGEYRKRRRARVHGDRHPHPRVRARELLENEDVGEEVRTSSAVLFGHADSHETEVGELRVEIVRKAVLAVPGAGVGNDLRLGELTGEPLDLLLLRRQLEVHDL